MFFDHFLDILSENTEIYDKKINKYFINLTNINVLLKYLLDNNFSGEYENSDELNNISYIYTNINNISRKSLNIFWHLEGKEQQISFKDFMIRQNSIYNFLSNNKLQNKKAIIYQQEMKNFIKNITTLHAKSFGKDVKDIFVLPYKRVISLMQLMTIEYENWFGDIDDNHVSQAVEITDKFIKSVLV